MYIGEKMFLSLTMRHALLVFSCVILLGSVQVSAWRSHHKWNSHRKWDESLVDPAAMDGGSYKVPNHGACGGKLQCGYDKVCPGYYCDHGYSCQRQDTYWWYCKPSYEKKWDESLEDPDTMDGGSYKVPNHGACGGKLQCGYDKVCPGYYCDHGYSCQRQDAYWWYCKPSYEKKWDETMDGGSYKVPNHGACGGKKQCGYDKVCPGYYCDHGYSCQRQDAYWWYCKPSYEKKWDEGKK